MWDINFKDSASPFAESLIELHHNIMFYLIVIVSLVLYILIKSVNATRVQEPFLFFNFGFLAAFLKYVVSVHFFFYFWIYFLLDSDIFLKLNEIYINTYELVHRFVVRFNCVALFNSLVNIFYLNFFIFERIENFVYRVEFWANKLFLIFNSSISNNFDKFSFPAHANQSKAATVSQFFEIFLSFSFFYKSPIHLLYWIKAAKIANTFELLDSTRDLNVNANVFAIFACYVRSFLVPYWLQIFNDKQFLNYRYFRIDKPVGILKYSSLVEKITFFESELVKHWDHNGTSYWSNFITKVFYFSHELGLKNSNKRIFNLNYFTDSSENAFKYSFLQTQDTTIHNTTLEIIWTIIPTIVLVLIAIPSFVLLYSLDEVINPSITLKAVGHQWYWSYEYSDYTSDNSITYDSYMVPESDLTNGQFRLLEVDHRVVLPVNTHIRVVVTSGDVLHSWAIPSMTIKADAIPGRLNQLTLFIKRPGIYYGQCSELCGVNHGFMPIVIEAVSLKDYACWVSAKVKYNLYTFANSLGISEAKLEFLFQQVREFCYKYLSDVYDIKYLERQSIESLEILRQRHEDVKLYKILLEDVNELRKPQNKHVLKNLNIEIEDLERSYEDFMKLLKVANTRRN